MQASTPALFTFAGLTSRKGGVLHWVMLQRECSKAEAHYTREPYPAGVEWLWEFSVNSLDHGKRDVIMNYRGLGMEEIHTEAEWRRYDQHAEKFHILARHWEKR